MITFRRSRASFPKADAATWWGLLLAGACFGLLTSLSLPPVDFWPLTFVAIVPLMWAGCRTRTPAPGAVLAGLGTLPAWFLQQAWLTNVSAPGYPFLCVYMAAYPAIFVWIIAQARRVDWVIPMWLVAPLAWTMLEVVRGEIVFDGYAWFLLGHPLIHSPVLAHPAAVFGAYAVSFLCAALAGAVADAAGWAGVPRQLGGLGAAATAVAWAVLSIIGAPAAESSEARDVRVGVVQTNLPQDNKISWPIYQRLKDFGRFKELTRLVAATDPPPDVIVWPETMFPGRALNPEAVKVERDLGVHFLVKGSGTSTERVDADRFATELQALQAQLKVPMLVGAIAIDGDYAGYLRAALGPDAGLPPPPGLIRRYNSSFVIAGGAVVDRYDKAELTPFGEIIPYVWRWPALQQMVLDLGAQGMAFDLAIGSRIRGVLVPETARAGGDSAGGFRVATPICFEATKASLCRRLVLGSGPEQRSDALVNVSNDGWFGWWDGGREQHLLASRWRCVELRVPMVRSVNTGVSSIIDRRGGVVTERLLDRPEGARRVDGVLAGTIRIDPGRSPTVFERVGMIPAYAATLAGAAGTLVLWLRRRRSVVGPV